MGWTTDRRPCYSKSASYRARGISLASSLEIRENKEWREEGRGAGAYLFILAQSRTNQTRRHGEYPRNAENRGRIRKLSRDHKERKPRNRRQVLSRRSERDTKSGQLQRDDSQLLKPTRCGGGLPLVGSGEIKITHPQVRIRQRGCRSQSGVLSGLRCAVVCSLRSSITDGVEWALRAGIGAFSQAQLAALPTPLSKPALRSQEPVNDCLS
ncbi:hypothetical protein BJY00DRAFT_263113 [Aspergillus carlsbadensis]|nr:hypothetical protein BJY00DRAFT_263113 [Aspergillus carlsbadensis]